MRKSVRSRLARKLFLETLEKRDLLTGELAQLNFQILAVNSDGSVGENLDPNPNDSVIEAEVEVGQRFVVRTLVKDLRGSSDSQSRGLFSVYSNLQYSDLDGRSGERLLLQWGDFARLFVPDIANSGTFRLRIGGSETAAISTENLGNPSLFKNQIRSRLESLATVGLGNINVSWERKTIGDVSGVEYVFRFQGQKSRMEMPDLQLVNNQIVDSSNQPVDLPVTNSEATSINSTDVWRASHNAMPIPDQSNTFTNGIRGTVDTSEQTEGRFWLRELGGFIGSSPWSANEATADVAVHDVQFVAGALGNYKLSHHFLPPQGATGGFGIAFLGGSQYLPEHQIIWPQAAVRVVDRLSAMPDSFSVIEDSGVTLFDVMANDRLLPGTTATIVSVSAPISGTVSIQNGNRIAFTPGVNQYGQVSFDYTIRDNLGNESVARVSVDVQPVNDVPTLDPIANIRTTYNEVGREIILRNVTAGPGEESQDFTIEATSDRPDLIQILDVETQSASGLATLKLQTIGGGEGQAIFNVRVRDSGGLMVQRSFTVDVIGIQSATPFQNNANMLDVDNDGFVSPLDVLNILNRLSALGDASIPVSSLTQPPPPYFDVNGDNYIDPLDATSIIDAINGSGSGGGASPRAAKGERILEFRFQIVDQNGVNLDPDPNDGATEGLVDLGSAFYVQLLARDLRSVPAGLYASYSNLVYTNVDGSPASRIEPMSIANDGSIVGSLETVLGGLKQGVLVDNRSNVAGQRILAGIGEMSNRVSYDGNASDFHVVMKTKFTAKEKGIVDLSQQLSDFLMGVPGFVLFNSTGDYLGPAEVLLPAARIFVSDAVEAFDDTVTGMEDKVLVIDVLANDVDVTRTASIVTPLIPPSIGGELSLANGRIEYRPPANFHGSGSFSYTIRTVDGREDSAMVTITIEPVNDAPTITDLPNLSLPEGLTYNSEIFSISSGPQEDQPLRLTAVSNNNTVIPNPTLERVSDESYRMIFLPPVGVLGATTVVVTVEDGGLDGLLETAEDNLSVQRSFVVTVTQNQRDFGDAPTSSQSGMLSSYPARLDQNGAFHIGAALRLGDLRDAESDGFPDPLAKGDDNSAADDEDGILFPFTHPINDKIETTSSYVANVSQNGFLDVWIDFNRDGDWDDPGENISRKVAVQVGRNLIPFQIPTLPLTGTVDTTFGRFRLSRTGELLATGFGGEGEVEDHIMVMNRSFSQELEVYDHILGPHKVNVVDGFLVVTVGDMIVFRAPAENTSVFRRKNMSGETTFEMRNPGRNLPGQLSHEPVSDRIELTLARSDFDLGANTEFLVGLNTIRFGHTSVPSVLSLELEAVQNINSEKTLRIEMSREDSLRTESPWRPASGRMQDGRWVQVFTVASSLNSTDPIATLEVVSEAFWRNETRVTDADGDATTSPLDVLSLVNFINAKTFGEEGLLPPRTDSSLAKFPDVDGDQFLSALDVLNVINFLNTRGNGAGGNGEGEGASLGSSIRSLWTISPEEVHEVEIRPEDIDRYMYAYMDDFDQDNRSTKRRRTL